MTVSKYIIGVLLSLKLSTCSLWNVHGEGVFTPNQSIQANYNIPRGLAKCGEKLYTKNVDSRWLSPLGPRAA